MCKSPIPPLEASTYVAAPPDRVWAVVSDVVRMGEWSPECIKMIAWRGVSKGAWVTGVNRRKLVVWPTNSRIHVYDERHAIGWKVFENRARWTYELKSEGNGTRLTERREMPVGRNPVASFFTRIALGGDESHDEELLDGMRTTLDRIKAAVESK